MRVVVAMVSVATDGAGKQVRLACRLKEAGEVVQLDRLAYCLAHPALHRKLVFALRKLRKKHAGWVGGSIAVPVEQRGDIYIDAADPTTTDVWRERAKAQGWVLAQLGRRGSECGRRSRGVATYRGSLPAAFQPWA